MTKPNACRTAGLVAASKLHLLRAVTEGRKVTEQAIYRPLAGMTPSEKKAYVKELVQAHRNNPARVVTHTPHQIIPSGKNYTRKPKHGRNVPDEE